MKIFGFKLLKKENDMKKIIFMSCLSATIISMFTGCGKSAVKCDDSDAKALVMEITEGEFKNQLTKRLNPYATYEFWQKVDSSDDERTKQYKQQGVQTVDKQYTDMAPKLSNIRIDRIDDEIEKSECSADIEFANGKKAPITYILSKTSEGKLYAEVFGLK
jgi:hypothetical protein